jgi:hypothetical protein
MTSASAPNLCNLRILDFGLERQLAKRFFAFGRNFT